MATSSSYQILNKISDNLSNQNKFQFTINIPTIIETDVSSENIMWYIKSASLPSLNLNLVETKHLGKTKYAVTSATIDTINVTFYDTKEQSLRKMWVTYLETISMNNEYNILQYYPNEYQTSGTILVHDTEWLITGACPISVGDFILDYNSDNSLGTFDVSFKVKSCK